MAAKAKKAQKKLQVAEQLPEKKYMRPDEVATYFNTARSTIYLWVDHGLLESCKPTNGTVRITVESVKRLEAKGLARGLD